MLRKVKFGTTKSYLFKILQQGVIKIYGKKSCDLYFHRAKVISSGELSLQLQEINRPLIGDLFTNMQEAGAGTTLFYVKIPDGIDTALA